MRAVPEDRRGARLVHEGMLEESHADLGFEHPADGVVQRGGVDLPLGERSGEVEEGRAREAHLHVEAGAERPDCRVTAVLA